MEEGEKSLSDRPPDLYFDVEGEGGKKVPVVKTVKLDGDTVYQRGAGNSLTLEQQARVQNLTRGGKVEPALQKRVVRARKIKQSYAKRRKQSTI